MTDCWALFDDGTVVYMGTETRAPRFGGGDLVFTFESIVHHDGTVTAAGLRSGDWKTVAYLDEPQPKAEAGSTLTLTLTLHIPSGNTALDNAAPIIPGWPALTP